MTQQTEGSEQMEQSLIDIAVESWRFSRLFGKVVSKLDAGESGRYANQLRYFQKKVEESLESSGLKLVNVEGQPYDPGMAASASEMPGVGLAKSFGVATMAASFSVGIVGAGA